MAKARKDRAERLHQSIARVLGSQILAGERQPGCSIDGEIEQSAALGVSRTAYREAVRILVAKGLLESRPRAGTRVTPREHWNLLDPDLLSWMFQGEPDPAFIKDLFELRQMIEPAAASLAARRRRPEQVEAMRRCLATMRAATLATEAGQEADRQFHRLILEASGNAAVVTLASSIGAAVRWTTHFKQSYQSDPRDPLPEHEDVFTAIAAGDEAAAAARMQVLLDHALADMTILAFPAPAPADRPCGPGKTDE
jgi:DNA-binding FadR family transcriptional regulator